MLEALGRGGMGIVFKCHDRRLNRLVAVKRMLRVTERSLARFRKEAQAVAGLNHPNVLQVHDFDEDEAGPYIIMELATGLDLHREVKANGPLTLERSIEVVTAVGEALSHAHGYRNPLTGQPSPILHRDIKPSNILQMADGTPKLGDFGLARTGEGMTVTMVGQTLGTPVYMAPEQAEGAHEVGPEADLCSLGKTLYFLLTGRSPAMVMLGHLPEPLRPVVMQCLEERPEDRYRTAEAFVAALDEVLAQSGKAGRGIEERSRREQEAEEKAVEEARLAVGPKARREREEPERRPRQPQVYAQWPFDEREVKRRQQETAEALGLPVEIEVDSPKGVKMAFVLIPAGEFMMGDQSAKPIHKVALTKPFYLGKYQVTQAQWSAVMGQNPSDFKGDQNPVERVSWNDCQEFIKKLNASVGSARFSASSGTSAERAVFGPEAQTRRDARTTSLSFGLPTEAQWEYACRAGSDKAYCFGEPESELREYAWFDGNSGRKTHPVGTKKPNGWGLYDMHGNVWEWCEDWYGDYRDREVVDPTGPEGSRRVYRGGSWSRSAGRCRSAYRLRIAPDSRRDLGCRLILRSYP